jgi:hypothetical protein
MSEELLKTEMKREDARELFKGEIRLRFNEVFSLINAISGHNNLQADKRDLAIAITHLEDANMRLNRCLYNKEERSNN